MEVRIDKFLWAVRIYKTRALATEACRLGKVKVNGSVVKASKNVLVGEKIEININPLHKQIEVIELLNNRVSAKMVSLYITDLTSKEEYNRVETIQKFAFEKRDHGEGRPTKKERRDISSFKDI
ncbi:MAG: RNA-binding S4 domain-containing protein [Bacteroidales bacterium]|jgi:ribosome-associated heat shock protein Hsp15|nr:RNA-binding S4 domain-containing protein [Bacteroidales bacterium]